MLVSVVAVVTIFQSVAGDAHPIADSAKHVLRFAGLLGLAFAGLTIRRLSSRLPLMETETEVDTWWSMHLAAIVTLWAIAEGVGVLGSVLWFLVGDTLVLVVLAGASIALLLRLGPARWQAAPSRFGGPLNAPEGRD